MPSKPIHRAYVAKDRSREPLLGPPADMLVSRDELADFMALATPAQPDTSAKVEAAIGELERMTGIDAVEKEAIKTVVAAWRDHRRAQPDTGDVAALREALERARIDFDNIDVALAHSKPSVADAAHMAVMRIDDALAALSKPNAPGREG